MPSQHALGSLAPQTLVLPSMRDANNHNTCSVKRLTPADLIAGDLLDRFDSLTGLIGLEIDQINGKPPADTLAQLKGNKDQIKAALNMVDEIVEMSLVDPVVYRPVDAEGKFVPLGNRNRDTIPRAYVHVSDPIWTDMVDPNDKNAIVEFAMAGVRAVEPFRHKTPGDVGVVRTKSKVRKSAQHVDGD